MQPSELREHAVMDTLVRSRQLWDAVKDLADKGPAQEQEKSLAAMDVVATGAASKPSKKTSKNKPSKVIPDPEELEHSDTELEATKALSGMPKEKSTTKKGKSKRDKSGRVDLQELLAQSAIPVANEEGSDFGDEEPLTADQAAEKARKKKSLRFYTSQIAQKANKRGAASRGAGGDDDVPHKERMRDKQERLLKEAERRGQEKPNPEEELNGADDDVFSAADGEEATGYYEKVTAQTQQKKADKKARAEAYAEAARLGAQVYEEEVVGTDGKRGITYAIEKNKGLAPKRKKDVRNPRVKKRKKYDEKMKKLGSIRQVYKGGEGRGGYGGELTGIKTNTVRSIKL